MRFIVEGKIRGKERPRFYKNHAYTPKNTSDYEKAIVIAYRIAGGRCLTKSVNDPVKIRIIAQYAPNKSDTKKLRASKLNNEIPATLKPDNDNILKVVQDALQDGVAFHDDKQVVRSDIIKCYGEDEKLIVDVDVMGEEDYERLKRVVDSSGVR